MAYDPAGTSVVVFQPNASKLVATVSVSGVVQSSVQGNVGITNTNINIGGSVVAFLGNSTNASIITVGGSSGPSSVQLLSGTNIIGSVATLQGTNPWVVQLTSGSVITAGGNSSVQVVGTIPPTSVSGVGIFNTNNVGNGSIIAVIPNSVATVIIGGSVAVATGNSSVQLLGGTNTIGSVATLQGTNPWVVQLTSGSIVTAGGNSSVQVNNIVTGQSSVYLIPGVGVLGSVAALQGTQPWLVQVVTSVATRPTPASVQLLGGTNVVGSVAVLQGTNPWIVGQNNGSITGTYGVNSVFANNNAGDATYGVRNDVLASTIGVNNGWGPLAVDAMGRVIVQYFPMSASVFAHASTVNAGDAASVVVLAAPAAGLKNYITDYQITNTGAADTLVTFTEGGASILGKTIAPAGGGSNMPGMLGMLKNQKAAQPINMVVATASSTVHVTMYGFIAP